jgi:hypothetical protein
MRKDVREFIRRLEAAGLTIESTASRSGKPTGCPSCCRSPPTRPGGAEPRSSTYASSASTSSTPASGSRNASNRWGQLPQTPASNQSVQGNFSAPPLRSSSTPNDGRRPAWSSLPRLAPAHGHKTDTSETTCATLRDAWPARCPSSSGTRKQQLALRLLVGID